jgi:hypothetical protein
MNCIDEKNDMVSIGGAISKTASDDSIDNIYDKVHIKSKQRSTV